MVTADYHYPDGSCLANFFAIKGWKIVGMAPGIDLTFLNLGSQSGAHDSSATSAYEFCQTILSNKVVSLLNHNLCFFTHLLYLTHYNKPISSKIQIIFTNLTIHHISKVKSGAMIFFTNKFFTKMVKWDIPKNILQKAFFPWKNIVLINLTLASIFFG